LTKYLTLLIIVLLAVYKVLRRNTGGNKTFNNVMQGLSDAIGAWDSSGERLLTTAWNNANKARKLNFYMTKTH